MTRGVVSAGHALTAEAAAAILRRGGNAFDASLAALAMATVAEPVLCSLGGGGFLMARAGDGETVLYDFFVDTPLRRRPAHETAMLAVHADFGPARQEFHIGLGASATPGIVPGMFAIHADLCTLPLAQLLQPAIEAARQGFRLSAFQAYLFGVIAPILTASEGARAIFAPEGHLLGEGDLYANPHAAETLIRLAEQGEALFTRGAVGAAIAAQSNALGGHLTSADLAAFSVAKRAPLRCRHQGCVLDLNPPPAASGALIAYGLSEIEARGLDAQSLCDALAATNRARAEFGHHALAEGLSRDPGAAEPNPPAYRGTTHFSVIDEHGNVAALSLSNGEGNGHVVDGFGFMLNNMLGEADLVPDGGWPEGVRLSSMMAPTIIEGADGSLTALGTGGSNRIRSAVLQVSLNLIARGMGLPEAVAAPRMHVETSGLLSFEPGIEGIEAVLIDALAAEAWPAPNLFFGGVHAARRSADGSFEAAGDPRRAGVAVVVE